MMRIQVSLSITPLSRIVCPHKQEHDDCCDITCHSCSPQIFSYSSLRHLSQRQICIPCKNPVFLCPKNTLTIFGSSSQYLPHDKHEPILFAPSWSARYSTLIMFFTPHHQHHISVQIPNNIPFRCKAVYLSTLCCHKRMTF